MPLAIETKDAMLRSQFSGLLWLGLTGQDGREETDANYKRQALTLDGDGPTDQLTNTEEIRFPPYAGASVVREWIVFSSGGVELGREALAESRRMAARERLLFEPGDLVIRLEG